MKASKSDKNKTPSPEVAGDSEYPYGLSINLNSESIEALGLTTIPDVGSCYMVIARAEVKSTSTSEYDGEGKQSNISLQITDMALEKESKKKPMAQRIYGDE
jgi:hypothetical protein